MKKKGETKRRIRINYIPVEGNMIEAIASAVDTNISSVLTKHGATLNIELSEILRNHAKV